MKYLISLFCVTSLSIASSFSTTNPIVQYQLSGSWYGTGDGATQAFFKIVHGSASTSDSYSESLPYQLDYTFYSSNSTKTPTATGSATINLTVRADTGAIIIGSTGTATASASCGSASTSSSKSSAGSDPHTNGPLALPAYVISGSVLSWTYDSVNACWVGIAPITTVSCVGNVSYVKAGAGDSRDQASATSTVGTGTTLITNNTLVVTQ